MSRENVELVQMLMPDPGTDIVRIFRDDELWATVADAFSSLMHPDFECVASALGVETRYGGGINGFRAFWLEWTAPWVTYRTENEQTIDCGDRVLQLGREFGRPEGSTEEVRGDNAAIWTFRAEKTAAFHAYSQRGEALAAVGLEG
jgi:ketosteroid isomerase-like protein